ncbi:type II secretion system F family protein [Knoellia sp. LjRoot47]|uniref:type II secretion system F family protein n=1 Tax=Knoellia sp. LjRoot47 TaxID=3342330 RepID=UPI003ED06871
MNLSSGLARAFVTLAAGAALLGPATSATAAEPLPASIGGVRVTADHVIGVLTLRPGGESVSLDPGMTATVGGKTAPVSSKSAKGAQRTTVLLIDTSGSMGRSGMETVRSAVKTFLASAPKDVKIGVVSFGNTAGPELAPTADRSAVQRVVDVLRADGNTALFGGVTEAVKMLGASGDRSIVLLSDGANTVGDRAPGLAASVKALTTSQVRVEVVRFTTSENDPEALAAFAKAGGGSVAQATDTAGVRAAFGNAAKVLDSQVEFDITKPAGVSGKAPVVLRGSASGRPFLVQSTINLGVRTPVEASPSASPTVLPELDAAPAALVRVDTGVSTSLLAALGAVFVGALILVLAVIQPFKSERHERVAEVEMYTLAGATRASRHQEAAPSAVTQSAVRLGEKVMDKRESTSRTMELIQRADLPLRAGEWFVLRVVAVVLGAFLVPFLVPVPWWISLPLGIVLGVVLPAVTLRVLASKRSRKFEAQLPDIMLLVATTLASGFSLTQALDAVARDAAEPGAKEFSRALAENRIGTDISDALDHLATRMDSDSLTWTTMAIRIQREVGGNLAETLRTTAHTLRERESLKRQVAALSAEGKLTAYVLIALPVGIFLYMLWVNPEYISLLWTTLPGIVLLVGSCLGMVVGALWMRKLVKIEV